MSPFEWVISAPRSWAERLNAKRRASRCGNGSPANIDHFVVVLSQGRTGSTLILRMLNALPNVRLCGENYRAFDHLKLFADCFRKATLNHTSDFYKLAWLLPCDPPFLLEKMRAFACEIYNPGGTHKVIGFKEIRYCRFENGSNLEEDMGFLRELFPNLRVIFNVRRTEDCVKSKWWADDPEASAAILNRVRATFRAYYDNHRDFCYWMPFEELKAGSDMLNGMFDFIGVRPTPSALKELEIKLRD